MRCSVLLVVAACGAPSVLPSDPAPAPYPGFTLSSPDGAYRGGLVEVVAQLPVPPAPPNGLDVFFVEGGGLGPGVCHPALRGSCLDVTGPYTVHGPFVSGQGIASLSLDVDLGAPDNLYFQAVVFPPRQAPAALSTPLEVPVLTSETDFAFCGLGAVVQCVDPADLTLWLRADEAGAAGAMATWTDLSDADTHLTQGAVARQPMLVADAIGGRAAVRFDGVDDRLDLPVNLFAAGSGPKTVTVVLNTTSTDAHILGTGSSSAGFLDSYGSGLTVSAGRATTKSNSVSSGVLLSSPAPLGAQPHVLTYVYDGAVTRLYVDGEAVGESSAASNGHGYSRSTLGASDGSASNASRDALMGDVGEVLVFDRAISDTEREELERGLGGFYGIDIWEPTGCDGVVGSGAMFDACGVCEGDGMSCAVIDGLDPALWLRGDDLHGSLGGVETWSDASNAGNDAQQASPGRQPVYAAASVGGHGSVFFDGVDDRLDLVDNAFGSGEYPKTVFVVLQTSDASGHVLGTGSSSNGFLQSYGGGLVIDGGDPVAKANSASAGLYALGAERIDTGVPTLVTLVMTSGATEVLVNGALVGSSTSPVSAHTYSRSTLGASDGSASGSSIDPFEGWVAEVVSFDRTLAGAERREIERYLSTRYGLELRPEGDIGGLTLWLDAAEEVSADGDLLDLWVDRSPRGNDAAQTAPGLQPTLQTVGGTRVVRFDGVDDRLDLLDNAFAPAAHPLTVFAVMRSSDPDGHIVGTGSSGAGFLSSYGGGLVLEQGSVAGKARSVGSGTWVQDAAAFDDGSFHLVSFVSQSGDSRLYVDGAFVDGSTEASNAHGYSRSTIGASDGSASNASRDPLDGDIAELRVYGHPLSDGARETIQMELAAKHGLPLTPPGASPREGLSLFWRMDEAGDGDRSDVQRGLGVSPWPTGAGTVPIAGKVGMAQQVDGPNGYHFWRPSHADLDHGGGSFTWAGWVRLDSLYDSQTFVGKWEYTSGQAEYRIYLDAPTQQWVFEVSSDGSSGPGHSLEVVHPTTLTLGEWVYLEAWHDAAGEIGLRVGDANTMGAAVTAPWTHGVHFGNDDLNIAAHNQCADDHLEGAIDAVGVWRRVLTPAQRDAVWNTGMGWEP